MQDAIVWKRIAGAVFAASVTRIMGIASPLQLLLRYKPGSCFEDVLFAIAHITLSVLSNMLILFKFLPVYPYLLCALYWAWAAGR